jgi:hypothetical protein
LRQRLRVCSYFLYKENTHGLAQCRTVSNEKNVTVNGYSERLKAQAAREEIEQSLNYFSQKLKRNDGKYYDHHDNSLNKCVCGNDCKEVKPLNPAQFAAAMEKGDKEGRAECLAFNPSVVAPLLRKFKTSEEAINQTVNFADLEARESDDDSDHEREAVLL